MVGLNGYYFKRDGAYDGQNFFAENIAGRGRVTTKFTIAKTIDVQTSFTYRAPNRSTQGTRLSMYFWDIGASMDVLKGNGSITFNVRDVLNSRKRRWELNTPTLVSTNDFQWRSRQFTLAFSYRINQKKKRGDRGQRGEFNSDGNEY